jgi:hypothetical protein
MKSGNACYYSVQGLMPSILLSKNIKSKIHRNIILSVDLHECETWSLTLMKEFRLGLLKISPENNIWA